MIDQFVLSLFLYFPKDKREYIPAVISLLIFMILAAITMRLIIVYSKREAKKAELLEEKLKQNEKNWNS
jgi:flagellar biosynthesis/type III secretory pathway M-ring protein FliF/YscJ